MNFKAFLLLLLSYIGYPLSNNKESNNIIKNKAKSIILKHKATKSNTDASINILMGDITNTNTEAIVNAANADLLGGGGVCGAIFKAAGNDKLQKACNNYQQINGKKCPTGESRITDSFNLSQKGIKYIIHTVGPDCRIVTDEQLQDELLKNAYKSALTLADEKNIKSISFPFISSAIYAFPKQRAAKIAINTVNEYIKDNKTQIKLIQFILFSKEDYELFNKLNN